MRTIIIYRDKSGEWGYDFRNYDRNLNTMLNTIRLNSGSIELYYLYGFNSKAVNKVVERVKKFVDGLNQNNEKQINFSLEYVLDPTAVEDKFL